MMPPHFRSVKTRVIDEGTSEATLYNWRLQARAEGILLPDGDTGPDGMERPGPVAAVMESESLNEQKTAAKAFFAPARAMAQGLRECLRLGQASQYQAEIAAENLPKTHQ